MKTCKHGHPTWHHYLNVIVISLLFIGAGILLLARNLGYLDPYLFGLIVSWQTLLIIIGALHLIKGHFFGGLAIAAAGTYFLLPHIHELDNTWAALYWPVILIGAGIWLFFKLWSKRNWHQKKKYGHKNGEYFSGSYTVEEGFINSDVNFGGIEHIVLDPVFRGAHIRNNFGATMLDLRHTTLAPGKTYIDIECNLGGIELYIPSAWNLSVHTDTNLAGYSDKRFVKRSSDNSPLQENDSELIIRGKLTLSGMEIKN